MTKTVLITGVAGFLGRYVAREFSRSGWKVVGIDDRSPENAQLAASTLYQRIKLPSPALADLVRVVKPDACVHCAGRASVPLSLEDPAADFRDGTFLTFELLETLRQFAPRCSVIFLSSAAVYGNPQQLPISESAPVAPLSPYGYHKRLSELLCEEFSTIYSLPTASVRVFSAYGPGLRRQVIWDVCERALTTGTVSLKGTGRESRDFIHGADVARGIVAVAEHAPCRGEAYNLATGVETTIREVADSLLSALCTEVQPVFDGSVRTGDPLNWRADISRIKAIGFVPSISLEQGLRTVATWASAELATP